MRRSRNQWTETTSLKEGQAFTEWGLRWGILQERQFSEEVSAIQCIAGLYELKSSVLIPFPNLRSRPSFFVLGQGSGPFSKNNLHTPYKVGLRWVSGKKKAHKHKLFCPVGLGTPRVCPGDFTGFVPGTNPVKTWDTPGFSPCFTQWKPDFTGFIPGTNPVKSGLIPGTKGGTESLCEKSLCAFFAH